MPIEQKKEDFFARYFNMYFHVIISGEVKKKERTRVFIGREKLLRSFRKEKEPKKGCPPPSIPHVTNKINCQ